MGGWYTKNALMSKKYGADLVCGISVLFPLDPTDQHL